MQMYPVRALGRATAPTLALLVAGSSLFLARPAAADGVQLTPYGYIRLDGSWDDSVLDNHQVPQYVKPEAVGSEDNGVFTWHTRLTRLGLGLSSPQVAPGVDLGGKVEVDFYGGGTDTRHMLRMRLAYITIKNRGFEFRVGQDWSVISPTFPAFNDDAVGWNVGSPGDRRRQVRVTYTAKVGDGTLDIIAAAVPAGGIDGEDLDGNGIKDGDDSGMPGFMGRLTLKKKLWGKSAAELGVWGAWEREVLSTPLVVGTTEYDQFTGYVVGGNFELPVIDQLSLRGEGWIAKNGNDYRAGIGQGVNKDTGEEIEAKGGWVEVVIKPIKRWSTHVGFSADDPDPEQVPADGRTLNSAYYLVNKFNPYGTIWFGQEFIHWTTKYKYLDKGVDNRFELWVMYKF